MKNLLFLSIVGLVFNACSTASVRVMPGEDGVNTVISKDIESDDAEEEAVKAANKYCEKEKLKAVFVKTEATKYNGSMDESTRKNVRNASKVGMILGGAGAAGDATRGAGAVLGTAGTVGYGMTSDRDYTSELKFKCK
jgi:hypothetical protein